jgi:pSer/pThr/pTyr-binding forkhead associated (FHA) protein
MNCPNCHKENRPGLLLCEHCGHQLITLSNLSRYKTSRLDAIEIPWKPYEPPEPPQPSARPGTGTLHQASSVTLDLIGTDQEVRVPTQGHISLGRADKDSNWQPTVDLTPYGATDQGVSRMHVDLFFESDQVFVLELGSANGTRLNGAKVTMGVAQQIRDGDELELGRMRICVHFS